MDATESQIVIDRNKVEQILSSFTLPNEIERIERKYGPDHTGDASVFLTFHVREDAKIDTEGMKRLSSFISQVANALLNNNVGGFAYTRLEQAA